MARKRFDAETATLRADEGLRRSFEEAASSLRKDLVKYIYRRTRDYHVAEDLCQEAMYRACRSVSSLETPEKVKNWLFRIAYHVVVDWLRNRSAKKKVITYLESVHPDPECSPGIDVILMDLEEKEEAREKVKRLWALVQSLPPIYREVFELRYRKWRPIAKIAKRVNLPEGNVKVRLFRARRMLAGALKDGVVREWGSGEDNC